MERHFVLDPMSDIGMYQQCYPVYRWGQKTRRKSKANVRRIEMIVKTTGIRRICKDNGIVIKIVCAN
jgi:hypothetical protein